MGDFLLFLILAVTVPLVQKISSSFCKAHVLVQHMLERRLTR